MSDAVERLKALGILVPEILLPTEGVDLSRWAVIACDQHTSNREYWREVAEATAGIPSTLELVLPEVYLEDDDLDVRLERIRASMERYLEQGILERAGRLAVFTERYTRGERPRRGLVVAVDLERYEYAEGSKTLIRATEETILSRLPVRERIRDGAPLEVPHIMLLLDDPDDTVFSRLSSMRGRMRSLYDTELMLGGGRISGRAVEGEEMLAAVAEPLAALADPVQLSCRYGTDDELLLAVGDGNHSLAAAKGVWERKKAAGADPETDPGRYALVEIVNLYDPALTIEPIHRLAFGNGADGVTEALRALAGANWTEAADARVACEEAAASGDTFCVVSGQDAWTFSLSGDDATLPQERVETEIERVKAEAAGEVRIDYIHGSDELLRLAGENAAVGVVMPGLERELLFPRVVTSGPLPRKMFSMGESFEKRYYLEARRIV